MPKEHSLISPQVKNPDGTITTRNANGQKTTRPPLRRGPNSANRLAAVAAANNTAAAKFQPLTRSKTAEPPVRTQNDQTTRDLSESPEPLILKTPASAPSDTPFLSSIYCSRACAQVEASRSTDPDLARKLSYDFHSPTGLHLITSELPMSDSRRSPHAPPSPLFISGSETSSNTDAPRSAEPAASSAPNGISFFNMHRDNADDAWRDITKQRRSSVHPSFRPSAGVAMAREASQASTTYSIPGQSSDSLNSLWHADSQEINLGRSTSGSGRIRMTPLTETPGIMGLRRVSMSSDKSSTIPVRPLPRSNLSQVSLSAAEDSAPVNIPPEFGSAPEHTLNLWNTYHNSLSATRGSVGNPISPSNRITVPSRRPSHTGPSAVPSASLQRPVGGTIRAKSRSDATWDSFGLDEVIASKKRQERISGVETTGQTPRQTIQVGQKGCMITYGPGSYSRRNSSSRPDTSDEEDSTATTTAHPGALAIPTSTRPGSTISPGRTPTTMAPPNFIPSRSVSSGSQSQRTNQIPDLASLRIGSGGACTPYLSAEHVGSEGTSGGSAPRSTWNWSKWEKEGGGRTYQVPEGLLRGNSNSGKTGLFFFK